MKTPVLFLDIDGVLLPGRAWMLPQNRLLHETALRLPRHEVPEAVAREAVFDPCAVALVNRICTATKARIVVCSSWRQTMSADRIRAKFREQGILDEAFHPSWVCGNSGGERFDKAADIMMWLEAHGTSNQGGWLVLDDTDVLPGATLRVDGREGLSTRDAAAVVRFFGSSDGALGVVPLAHEDLELVLEAFGDDRIKACRWLEGLREVASWQRRPSLLLAQGQRDKFQRHLASAVGAHGNSWR